MICKAGWQVRHSDSLPPLDTEIVPLPGGRTARMLRYIVRYMDSLQCSSRLTLEYQRHRPSYIPTSQKVCELSLYRA